jgi:hypothetical protein
MLQARDFFQLSRDLRLHPQGPQQTLHWCTCVMIAAVASNHFVSPSTTTFGISVYSVSTVPTSSGSMAFGRQPRAIMTFNL